MKAFYLNVQKNKNGKLIEIEDNLETFYELIQCRCIDIVRRRIGNKPFEIICDDEGALVETPIISAIDSNGNIMLVGNLIVFSGDVTEDGELTELKSDEIEEIRNNIRYIQYQNRTYCIIANCEY